MAVSRWPHCGLAQLAAALRKCWTCSKFPPCHRECPRFWQFSAVLRRSMMEPLRNHGDNGGATAVYAVQSPQWHRASDMTGVVLRRHGGTCSKCPPSQREGPRFWKFSAVLRRSITEPLRNHGCGLCRTSTAVAPRLRCDGGRVDSYKNEFVKFKNMIFASWLKPKVPQWTKSCRVVLLEIPSIRHIIKIMLLEASKQTKVTSVYLSLVCRCHGILVIHHLGAILITI